MKTLQEFPPNYDEIRKILVNIPETMVFVFGDTIYNPSGNEIVPALEAHEAHHSLQQGKSPQTWWRRYLTDGAFRASQEIPAYQMQYRQYKKEIKDRNKLNNILIGLAMELSSPAYGSIISTQEAMEAIKTDKLYNFRV